MKYIIRRKLAVLMSAAMLIACMPVNAYAEGPELVEAQSEEQMLSEETENPTDIADAETIAEPTETVMSDDEEGETHTEESGTEVPLEETLTGTVSEILDINEASDDTPSEGKYIILEAEAEDGMRVTLTAWKDAFETSEGLELVAEIASGSEAEEAGKEIDKETGTENVAKRVTYDIRVEKDGEELQPLEGKKVKVEFHLPEIPSGADEVTVYHHDEEAGLEVIATEDIIGATLSEIAGEGNVTQAAGEEPAAEDTLTEEELEEYEDTELINDLTAEGETDSFSLYTVDFTYEDKKVSLKGDSVKNPLAEILEEVGITDPVTGVEVYQDDKFSDMSVDGAVRRGDTVLFRVYEEEGTWYADAVNPFTSEHGIIIKTEDADYRVMVTDDVATDKLLTFTAVGEDSSITFKYNSGSAKYSMDGGSIWTDCPSGTTINLSDGESVKLKGTNVKTNNSNHFSMTGKIAASGDVTSLTNGTGGDAILTDSCCWSMFSGCTNLITGPSISATKLESGCCYYMFKNCTSLTEVTGSLAGEFGSSCCESMFNGCAKLATAPEIQATTMGGKACKYMFQNCTSLTEVTGSLAGEFGSSCCESMFSGCTNLITGPSISATKLESGCCCYMFQNCKNLTTSFEINATVMESSCCAGMFKNCTSLTEVTGSLAGEFGSSCCESMFNGCAKLATAPEIQATTMGGKACKYMFQNCTSLTEVTGSLAGEFGSSCCESMFSGCTNLITGPSISATKLESGCCCYMFQNCKNLTTSFEINATVMESSCCASMFKNCTSLTEVTGSLAGEFGSSCCESMFNGCAKLATAPEIQATTMGGKACKYMFKNCTSLTEVTGSLAGEFGSTCCESMFSGCTNLITGPSISATKLESGCCAGMFNGCKNLTEVTGSLAGEFGSSCCELMFSGCAKLATAPEIQATTMGGKACNGMFQNCKSLIVHSIPDENGIELLFSGTVTSGWNTSMFSGCTLVDLDGNNSKTPEIDRTYYITAKAFPYLNGISATEIAYGQALSESTVSGTARYAGKSVAGTWSFATPSIMPQVSDSNVTEYGVAFSPDDSGTYASSYGKTKLKVNLASIGYTVSDSYSGEYDGNSHSISVTVTKPSSGYTVKYSIDGGSSWATGNAYSATDVADSKTVEFKIEAPNHATVSETRKVTLTRKAVTVKAEDKSKIHYDADPVLTATVSGTLGTDTVAYSIIRDPGETTGEYRIIPCGAANQGNYHVTYMNGVFTINRCTCEVSFDMQGRGVQVATQSVLEGDKVTRPEDPYELGYAFGGWYKEAECANMWIFESDKVDSDTTIYAKWSIMKQEGKEYKSDRETWTATPSSYGSSSFPISNGLWVNTEGKFSYLDHGWPLKNTKVWISYVGADGKSYVGCFLFGKYGTMETGWKLIDGKWYYFSEEKNSTEGMMKTGWFVDPHDGNTYYSDPATGEMVIGMATMGGVQHHLNETVLGTSGWVQTVHGKWRYLGGNVLPLGALIRLPTYQGLKNRQ